MDKPEIKSEKKNLIVTSKVNYYHFTIYINGIMYIKYPRCFDIRFHCWQEGNANPIYKIEIKSTGRSDTYEFSTKQLWIDVNAELDKVTT